VRSGPSWRTRSRRRATTWRHRRRRKRADVLPLETHTTTATAHTRARTHTHTYTHTSTAPAPHPKAPPLSCDSHALCSSPCPTPLLFAPPSTWLPPFRLHLHPSLCCFLLFPLSAVSSLCCFLSQSPRAHCTARLYMLIVSRRQEATSLLLHFQHLGGVMWACRIQGLHPEFDLGGVMWACRCMHATTWCPCSLLR